MHKLFLRAIVSSEPLYKVHMTVLGRGAAKSARPAVCRGDAHVQEFEKYDIAS